MRKIIIGLAVAAGLSAAPAAASAGVYGDDLTKCVVSSASQADQITLMVWIFSAMSAHPAIQNYTKMTGDQRIDASRKAAQLMQRLIVQDCRAQSVAALKYEGPTALSGAFEVLGQVGMRALMNDPTVSKETAALGQFVDPTAFESLAKEAGVPFHSEKSNAPQ